MSDGPWRHPVTERRRICLVTETYPPEITASRSRWRALARGLRARGHAVSVVCPRQPTADAAVADGELDGQVTRVRGVALPRYREVRAGLPAGRRLREDWIGRRPDVVYVATEGPLAWSAVRAARQLGVPVFSGFHTKFPDYARHYRAGWLAPAIRGYLRRFHNRSPRCPRLTRSAGPVEAAPRVDRFDLWHRCPTRRAPHPLQRSPPPSSAAPGLALSPAGLRPVLLPARPPTVAGPRR